MQEIIFDYPETKKAISLGLDDIPEQIRSSFNSTAGPKGFRSLMPRNNQHVLSQDKPSILAIDNYESEGIA